MATNPLEAARNIATTGVTLTGSAATEAVKRSAQVSLSTATFMARQALRGLDLGVSGLGYGLRVMDAADNRSAAAQPESSPLPSMSTQDALGRLVTTLALTTTGERLQRDFDRVVDKIAQIGTVAVGIRMHDGPQGTVSMEFIAEQCVAQVVDMGNKFGIDSQLASNWVDTLRERTGIDGET